MVALCTYNVVRGRMKQWILQCYVFYLAIQIVVTVLSEKSRHVRSGGHAHTHNVSGSASSRNKDNILLKHKRHGDKSGLRVLIVSSSWKKLTDNSGDYDSAASVILFEYAHRVGYDFIRVNMNISDLTMSVTRNLCGHRNGSSTIVSDKCSLHSLHRKYESTAFSFHPGLKQYRSYDWTKLITLWYVAKEYGRDYDYIWSFDSEVTLNPVQRNRTLSDALLEWKSHYKKYVVWGPSDIREADIIFFNNFPQRADLPHIGTFIFKPAKAEPLLREWWDYNIPEKNFVEFGEQDALWLLLEADPELGFKLSKANTVLLTVPQYPSFWYGLNDLWAVHMPPFVPRRDMYWLYLLRECKLFDKEAFKIVAQRAIKHATLSVNTFAASLAMDRCSAAAALDLSRRVSPNCEISGAYSPFSTSAPILRKTSYPQAYRGRADDYWHRPPRSFVWPIRPPAYTLYNGMAFRIGIGKQIYILINNSRYSFSSLDAMNDFGIFGEMIHYFDPSDYPKAPDRGTLPS